MHSFSKIAGVRTIAISLAMMLTVFGAQSLKAKSNNGSCSSCNTCTQKTHCNSCDQKVHTCNTCPAPVKVESAPSNNGSCNSCNTCTQKTHCNSCDQKVHTCNTCPAPVKVEPAPCGSCQASCTGQAHARHEAEEDRARAERAQKKAADKAAHERAEADAAEQAGAQKAAKYQAEANQHLQDAGLLCPVKEEQTAQIEAPPAPAPEAPIVREKPAEPVAPAPPVVIEEQQTIITPAPAPEPVQEPKALPKTASPLDLIGLIGLLSLSGGVSRKLFRR